jgi:hypothetical protein
MISDPKTLKDHIRFVTPQAIHLALPEQNGGSGKRPRMEVLTFEEVLAQVIPAS